MRLPSLITALLPGLAACALAACEKSSSPDIVPPKDPASSGTTSSSVGTPSASGASVTSTASAPAVASSPAAVTGATTAPATSATPAAVTAGDAGKPKDGAAAKSASKRVTGKNFTLDLASAGCKAASECAMTIKLVAAGDYHVNKEYPYKFIATAAPNVAFLGKGDATTFTRAAGDFTEQGEKAGTMTVRFKPSSPGDTTVAGTYKFSVCSADQCQIEQEKIELAIPVI